MGSMPYSLVSEALDLTQMLMDIQKQLKLTYLIIPNNVFSTTLPKNHSLGDLGVNALHLGVQGSGPHPGGHVHQETTELTYFITPNKMCFNNVTKNSFLGTPWGQCPTPGCLRVWTSPRWSWTSRNSLKQLLSSYLTTFVSTILPKNHSL